MYVEEDAMSEADESGGDKSAGSTKYQGHVLEPGEVFSLEFQDTEIETDPITFTPRGLHEHEVLLVFWGSRYGRVLHHFSRHPSLGLSMVNTRPPSSD